MYNTGDRKKQNNDLSATISVQFWFDEWWLAKVVLHNPSILTTEY